MNLTVNTTELSELDLQLRQAGRVFDYRITGQALRDASKPMLVALRQEAPVGNIPRPRSTAVVRGRNKGKTRLTGGSYRKGGATRNDTRIKVVQGVGDEQARVLVGVSKSRGKVGWRTHLITRKNLHRTTAIDFTEKAYQRTIDVVISRFGASAQVVINRVLKKAR